MKPKDEIELPNGLQVAQLNRGETDFMYKEIFVGESYLLNGVSVRDGDLIPIVGASIGLFADRLAIRWKARDNHLFEPAREVFDIMEKNVALHDIPGRVHCRGLAGEGSDDQITCYPRLSLMSGLHSGRRGRGRTRAGNEGYGGLHATRVLLGLELRA